MRPPGTSEKLIPHCSIIICALYYITWVYVLPKVGGYQLRQEVIVLEGGAQTHSLIKVPVGELAAWDATHDATGRSLHNESGSETHETLDFATKGDKV